MPEMPAFCLSPTCGAVYGSGLNFESSRVTLVGNRSQCPFCGAEAEVPDGVFDFAESAIRVLSAPSHSLQKLSSIETLLLEARTRRASAQDIVSKAERISPEIGAALGRLLLPRTPEALYGLIAVLTTIVLAILSMRQSSDLITDDDVLRLRREVIEQVIQEGAPLQPPAAAPQVQSKTPVGARNKKAPKTRPKTPKSFGQKKKKKKRG